MAIRENAHGGEQAQWMDIEGKHYIAINRKDL